MLISYRQGAGGHPSQNLAVQQRKVEAIYENIAPSTNSSDCDCVASTLRNIEYSEKESDAHVITFHLLAILM